MKSRSSISAARRSQRIQSQPSSTQGSTSNAVTAKASPAKPKNGLRSRRRGGLSMLTTMPLDIVQEIFGHLQPMDALNLSRTTKAIRAVLMGRSARGVWTRVIANVEGPLPACPEDLTEPQYVNLMFTDYCHECLRNDVTVYTVLEARTQLCGKCGPLKFKRWQEIGGNPEIIDFVPSTPELFRPFSHYSTRTHRFFVDAAITLSEEYRGIQDQQERGAWCDKKKLEFAKIQKHAMECEKYVRKEEEKARKQEDVMRNERCNAIVARLKDQGWEEEIGYQSDEFYEHHLVYQAKELTEEDWRAVEPKLTNFLSDAKERRLSKERTERLQQRVKKWLYPIYFAFVASQPPNAILPNIVDVALMEEFSSVIEDAPLDTEITKEQLEAGETKLPEFAREWRDQKDQELLDVMRKSGAFGKEDEASAILTKGSLLFPTTFFQCRTCSAGAISYPDILTHSCLIRLPKKKGSTRQLEVERKKTANKSKGKGKEVEQAPPDKNKVESEELISALRVGQLTMAGGNIAFNEAAYHHAGAILDLFGLGRQTTNAELRELNPYVKGHCECYFVAIEPRHQAMQWIGALQRCHLHRTKNYSDCFTTLQGAEAAKVDDIRAQDLRMASGTSPLQRCYLCGYSMWHLAYHLQSWHLMSSEESKEVAALTPGDNGISIERPVQLHQPFLLP